MRQEISKPTLCTACNTILDRGETKYICDACGAELKTPDSRRWEIQIFHNEGEGKYGGSKVDEYEFCSIKHSFTWLKQNLDKQHDVNFITLPYIHPEDIKDLLNLI